MSAKSQERTLSAFLTVNLLVAPAMDIMKPDYSPKFEMSQTVIEERMDIFRPLDIKDISENLTEIVEDYFEKKEKLEKVEELKDSQDISKSGGTSPPDPPPEKNPIIAAKELHNLREEYISIDKQIKEQRDIVQASHNETLKISSFADKIEKYSRQLEDTEKNLEKASKEKHTPQKAQKIRNLERSKEQVNEFFKSHKIDPSQAYETTEQLRNDAEKLRKVEKLEKSKANILEERRDSIGKEYSEKYLQAEKSLNSEQVKDFLKQYHGETLKNPNLNSQEKAERMTSENHLRGVVNTDRKQENREISMEHGR